MVRLSEWKAFIDHHASKDVYCALIFMSQEMYIVGNHNYSREHKSVTASDLLTFFRADLIQSKASWKLSSTSDWLLFAWKDVNY